MKYANLIETLFERFPFLEQKYIEEGDYIAGLAHLCYSFVFIPYIREIVENNDIENIIKVSEYLEDMAICEDEKVSELMVVSILENIVSERDLVKTLKAYLKPNTEEWLLNLEKAYGWDNENTQGT
ncbi:MAG: hypothetical protein FWF18_03055 [Dehalococcoidia bacterium]|nr:hypothetical protein [Dehalococcoidia bacterium]